MRGLGRLYDRVAHRRGRLDRRDRLHHLARRSFGTVRHGFKVPRRGDPGVSPRRGGGRSVFSDDPDAMSVGAPNRVERRVGAAIPLVLLDPDPHAPRMSLGVQPSAERLESAAGHLHGICTEPANRLRDWNPPAGRSHQQDCEARMHPFVRLVGIISVFMLSAIGWLVLGGVTSSRTSDQRSSLDGRVADLWGSPQTQAAPVFELHWTEVETKTEQIIDSSGQTTTKKTAETVQRVEAVDPAKSRITVDLHLDQRRKGLLWFPLYDVAFRGSWEYHHTKADPRELRI